jgi:hypothetical protein
MAVSTWRTKHKEFVLDLLSIVEDQITLAETAPTLHQKATIHECFAAIVCFKKRLKEDDFEKTQAVLIHGDIFNNGWAEDWQKLADAGTDEFLMGANKLREGIRELMKFYEER